ncbi:MAG: sigma 54-interacting transcriptional regulator [Planctomycetota bacterium]
MTRTRYELVRPLGSGGQASVWLAAERGSKRLVTLRSCHDAAAQLALRCALRHPGIASVLDTTASGDGTWLVEEYIPGPRWSERPPATPAELIEAARYLLSALSYLHAQGLVHRDIKPDNIVLFDAGLGPLPVLIDFGLAARIGEPALASGTLGTAAPEVLTGRRALPAADLFGVGTTLLAAALSSPPDPRWSLEPKCLLPLMAQISAAIRPLIVGLTSLDPAQRFATAALALSVLPPAVTGRLPDAGTWPLVGQDLAIDAACETLAAAQNRSFVLVVLGEIGSGKRRLADHIALRSVAGGARWLDDPATLDAPAPLRVLRADLEERPDSLPCLLTQVESTAQPLHAIVTTTSRDHAAQLEACLGSERCAVVSPARLSVAAIEELLSYLPGGASHDPEVLHEKTAGHPGSLAALVTGCLAPPSCITAAQVFLAVLDEPFSADDLHDEESPGPEDLRQACAQGLITRRRDGRYAIASPDAALHALQRVDRAAIVAMHDLARHRLGNHHPALTYHSALASDTSGLEAALRTLAASETPLDVADRRLRHLAEMLPRNLLWACTEAFPELGYRLIEASRLQVVRALLAGVTSDPMASPLLLSLEGRCLAEEGHFDEAVACIRHALAQGGSHRLEPYLDLARSLLATTRFDDALAVLAEAEPRFPNHPIALAEIGRIRSLILYRRGETPLAIEVARHALRHLEALPPSSLSLGLTQNLAMMLRHLGEIEGAARFFGEAGDGFLRLGDVRSACIVWINAAIAYQDAGELARAQALMERARVTAERARLAQPRDVATGGLGITLGMRGALAAAASLLARAEQCFAEQAREREALLARAHKEDALLSIGSPSASVAALAATLERSLELGFDAEAAVAWCALLQHGERPRFSRSQVRRLLRQADRSTREAILLALADRALEQRAADEAAWRRVARLASRGLPRSALTAHIVLGRHGREGTLARQHAAQALKLSRKSDSPADRLEVALLAIEVDSKTRRGKPARAHARRALQCLIEIEKLHPIDLAEDALVHTWTRTLDTLRESLTALAQHGEGHLAGSHLKPIVRACQVIHDDTLDDDQRFTLILEEALRITGAHRGLIITRDARGNERYPASLAADGEADPAHFELSRSLLDEVLSTGRPRITFNALEDPEWRYAASVVDFRLSSIACVPIKIGERIAGALYLDNPYERGVFRENAIELLETFAAQISLSLAAATQRREIARLNEELTHSLESRTCELEQVKRELAGAHKGTALIYQSEEMEKLMKLVRRLALTEIPVHINGETGTGKELIARRLHEFSPRRERPFVTENCAAIPDELLESELFGHVKGAFTGAHRDKPGLFRLAHGGTLFLDEIADMPLALQGKLLRVLQEGRVRPVGGDSELSVDVRLITATHRDLRRLADEGAFRSDLFYRIFVAPIELPALRARREDIRPLAAHFLGLYGRPGQYFERAAVEQLECHGWPGNVRELESAVRCAAVMARGASIGVDDLPETVRSGTLARNSHPVPCTNLRDLERLAIVRALDESRGNRVKAARLLGISRSSLFNKLREYDLHDVAAPPARMPRPSQAHEQRRLAARETGDGS